MRSTVSTFHVGHWRLVAACGLGLGLLACGGSDDEATQRFTVGGTVSGLTAAGLVLQNNGADDLALPAGARDFVFAAALAAGEPYDVSIRAQPSGQKCMVGRGQGMLARHVRDVQVNCAPAAGDDGAIPGPGDGTGDGDGGADVGAGAASACFNPALMTPGTRYRWHMQTQVEGQLVSMVQERRIEGGGSFAGASGLVVDSGSMSMTFGASGSMDQRGAWYYKRLDTAAGPVIVEYGGSADATTSAGGMRFDSRHEWVNTPPAEKREFALQSGQSYPYSATTRTTTRTMMSGVAIHTTVDTSTDAYRVTYLGQKEITVAAGTYPACHFSNATTEGQVDVYYSVGSGLPLVIASRIEDGGLVRMEMQPDSHVNGVPVSQYHASRQ